MMQFNHASPGRARFGFSVIEVLMALALVVVASALVVVNAEALLKGPGPRPIEYIANQAIREARYSAAVQKGPVSLRVETEDPAAFIIETVSGQELARFPIGYNLEEARISIDLLERLPVTGPRGDAFESRETEPIRAAYFHPDRSATPLTLRVVDDRRRLVRHYDAFSAHYRDED